MFLSILFVQHLITQDPVFLAIQAMKFVRMDVLSLNLLLNHIILTLIVIFMLQMAHACLVLIFTTLTLKDCALRSILTAKQVMPMETV